MYSVWETEQFWCLKLRRRNAFFIMRTSAPQIFFSPISEIWHLKFFDVKPNVVPATVKWASPKQFDLDMMFSNFLGIMFYHLSKKICGCWKSRIIYKRKVKLLNFEPKVFFSQNFAKKLLFTLFFWTHGDGKRTQ